MNKNLYINLIVSLIFILIIYDFYSLSKYKELLQSCMEVTNKCLFENKNPNEYLPTNIKYTCNTNCEYESGRVVEYKLSVKSSFFINPFQKEVSETYYYFVSDVKFYE